MTTAPPATPEIRGRRHLIKGVVVSDKMDKTRVVDVERRVRHPFYEKVITKHSRFYVHDEGNESHSGDLVEIMSIRPLSRLKRWRLVRIVKASSRPAEAKVKAA
jgi:small subunit ribosomal protein S17